MNQFYEKNMSLFKIFIQHSFFDLLFNILFNKKRLTYFIQ